LKVVVRRAVRRQGLWPSIGAMIWRRGSDLQRIYDSLSELVATCELPRADRRCALLEAMR
jgi:hypothetical protein